MIRKYGLINVEWTKNEKGEGVVCVLPYSGERPNIVFPSRTGFDPPAEALARSRDRQPGVGEKENVVLVPSPDGKVLFAYPSALEVDIHHGFFHVMVGGDAEVTVVPAFAAKVVAWSEDKVIHVTIEEAKS